MQAENVIPIKYWLDNKEEDHQKNKAPMLELPDEQKNHYYGSRKMFSITGQKTLFDNKK